MSAQLPEKVAHLEIDVSPARELIKDRFRGHLEELWLYHQLILRVEERQLGTRTDRIGLGVHEIVSLEDEPPGAAPGPLALSKSWRRPKSGSRGVPGHLGGGLGAAAGLAFTYRRKAKPLTTTIRGTTVLAHLHYAATELI